MSDQEERRKPGRPGTGRTRLHSVHVYLNDAEAGVMERLKERRGDGPSALMREGLRLLARQEGLE